MKNILIIFCLFIFFNNCNSNKNIKKKYDGFAILKFKTLENDGVDDFTFFLFDDSKNGIQQIPTQSITFPFPQNKEFINYKIEIKKRKWKEGDLILVKINYSILNEEYLEFSIKSFHPFYFNGKENNIINYSFYNVIDNNGNDLFSIKEIKFIKKL